jgi:fibronectin type 3 domain-containing protein
MAPPGYYMLFIVNSNGVPSVAPIVNLPVTSTPVQPPAAPTNLVANGGLGIASLTWTASTGPNGVSGYSVYRATSPGVVPAVANRVAQPVATNFVDTTMPASGTYYYVVTARDPAGVESSPSNEAVATVTADTIPPSDPSSLGASSVSNSQINLSWTGSNDNVGVAQYRVERCPGVGCANFAQIATPTGTTFNDTGLAASTSYSYRVRAADGAGNVSNYSNVASATTQAASQPPATPTFVQQGSAVPQTTSTSSVVVTYGAAQTAGNLNVVVVGWNDTTAAVASVTDTAGNVYTRAVGPTVGSALTQSIYYATNIAPAAAGANRVTVAFSPAAAYPDIRILEYSGIDPVNPVDTTAAAVGSTATSSSGAVATSNASDLLFGANMVATTTNGAGAGFISRVITSPDGDIAEDQLVAATGSYSATAPVSPAGAWVMQLVAFRAAGSPAPLARPLESGGPPVP